MAAPELFWCAPRARLARSLCEPGGPRLLCGPFLHAGQADVPRVAPEFCQHASQDNKYRLDEQERESEVRASLGLTGPVEDGSVAAEPRLWSPPAERGAAGAQRGDHKRRCGRQAQSGRDGKSGWDGCWLLLGQK